MLKSRFAISFNFPLDTDTFIFVKADVKFNAENETYHISNFRSHRADKRLKLPDIEIRTMYGRWVHVDSEVPTRMSEQIGSTIAGIEQNSKQMLQQLLERAIQVDHADFGNIQLLDRSSQALRIVAQKGFDNEFLEHFKTVTAASSCGCGDALKTESIVIIPDVLEGDWFPAHKNMVVKKGVRSVISVPVLVGYGEMIGMLSVHSSQPGREWEVGERQSIAAEIGEYVGQHLILE